MEPKKYIVFNRSRESFLSSSVTSVNAALEPLKVLKVLIEGLPANARTGLWLINFKGVPVARTLSPFDLIYLDKDFRILHSVELSKDGEFAPFKGQPASALVLPPRSITASKTRDGDQLELRVLEITGPEAAAQTAVEPSPTSEELVSAKKSAPTPVEVSPGARFYSSTAAAPQSPVSQEPLERFVSAQSTPSSVDAPRPQAAMSSAEPVPSGPAVEPENPAPVLPAEPPSGASATTEQSKRRRLVTGPIMSAPGPAPMRSAPPAEQPASTRAPIPFPTTAATRSAVPTIQEVPAPAVEIPITLFPQQRSSAKPQEEIPVPKETAALSPIPVPPPSPTLDLSPKMASTLPVPSEPVPLPPLAIPQPEETPDYGPQPKRKFAWKIRMLRWLFPELVIHEAPKPRDRRRADRQSLPGLIAYFFTGGAPEPHKINNISVTGFYLQTEDRWMPGTVVRMTLQKVGSKGDDPSETITVNSRIVRWGPDGEGFEFILTDLED
jgi:hypothetical protein